MVWAVRCAAALGRPLTRSCLSETANREMPTELDKSFDKSCRSASAWTIKVAPRRSGPEILDKPSWCAARAVSWIRRAHVARAGESFADQ